MVKGAMPGKGGGGCAWQRGSVHGEEGVWQRGACMVCMPPLYGIWLVNAQPVRILQECILVHKIWMIKLFMNR